MESLSPLVRNASVRRLSLELVQNFTSNLLSSPLGNKVRSSGRRASDACFESPRKSSSRQSPLTKFAFNLSPFRGQSPNVHPKSPFFPGDLTDDGVEGCPENKRPRKLSAVTCHVIPPTPKRRRASLSFSTSESFSPPKRLIPTPNKENEVPQITNCSRRSSASTTFSSGGTGWVGDLVSVARRFYPDLELRPHEVLGRGSFGTVISASYKGIEVAVKILRQIKSEDHLQGELNGLSLPSHPHIVSVLHVLRIPLDHRTFILLERMEPGNLLSLINDPNSASADIFGLGSIVDITSQIASALSFCHSHGILHLDVKPQNILLPYHPDQTRDRFSVKLSDFGNSKTLEDLLKMDNFNKLDGTVGYKAPELFRGDRPTEKCDVYSLGVTMWQLLTREQPYLGESEHSVIYKVVAQGLRPRAVCVFHNRKKEPRENQFVEIYERAWDGAPDRRQSMPHILKQLYHLRKQFSTRTTFHEATPLQSLSLLKTKQFISNY